MKEYTGWQYLLIDAYNHYEEGKLPFEARIKWAEDNLDKLEELTEQAADKPRYIKAVMAIRRAQAGKPIGHLVSLDASASGMQVMSAITGCHDGALATGLIDPEAPADAYSLCSDIMSGILGRELSEQKSRLKNAAMTSLYGSKREPENEFGEGTEELKAFYLAMETLAPGAVELLQALLDSWQPNALLHEWQLPDGFEARIRVMEKVSARIKVEELDNSSFTYVYHQNQCKDWDRKNAANVIHSIDAYIMRSLVRRCSYDPVHMRKACASLIEERRRRDSEGYKPEETNMGTSMFRYYTMLYENSKVPDLVILPHLSLNNVKYLSDGHLEGLWRIVNTSAYHDPFPLVAVHDDFSCHPNNMNHVRRHYTDILADLADSDIIQWILSQIHNSKGVYDKKSNNLGELIRKSAYALN